nr:exocyst complex component EXO70B1-like isoform X1 [Ipomoea trifida]
MRNPSSSPSPPHYTFCEKLLGDTIATVEPVIRKWDVQASATFARISYLFRDSPVEAKQFLGCVDDLQRAMRFSVTHSSDSELLVRAQTLMQIAMKRLQKEFYTILSGNRYFLDLETVSARSSRASSQSTVPDSEGDSSQEDGDVLDKVAGISIPDPAVADLKAIATYWPPSSQSPLPESYFSSPSSTNDDSTVSAKFAWLVLVLLCKLDSKARHYGDVPLSYFFLANNLNYVSSKVRNSNLSFVLGSDWISKQEGKVKQFIANYERLT